MDATTDSHLTQGNTIQNPHAEIATVDHELDCVNIDIGLNEDPVPGDLSASTVYLNLATDIGDGIGVYEGQGSIHLTKSDQESPISQQAGNKINQGHECVNPQNDSDQVDLPAISEEVPPSGLPMVPAGGSVSAIDNDPEVEIPTSVYSQELPSLRSRTASETAPRDERKGEDDLDDLSNCTRMLHTPLDPVYNTGLTHEEEIREDFDYPCEDFPFSQPPSSSPPQLFSSSPCASSQSSVNGAEPPKMVLVVEVEGSASSRDCLHADDMAPQATLDESCSEPKQLFGHDPVDVATCSETDKYGAEISCSPGPSKKRMACQNDVDEPYGLQPTKRLKLDPHLYPPPAPRRATLASQDRQFKKLAAPFRPPSKLPVARDEMVQAVNKRTIGSAGSSTPEISCEKPDPKEFTLPLQHKASDTSRSAAQFKSPLVNRVLPADSRTIRLTPALQTLERKLQLLKRAIKVKEDDDEVVLGRLAGKWIEAGREVAYDVWDATKDAGDFGGKATLVRRSYGWEGTNDGNTPWGWDAKVGDAGDETCDLDPSMAPCVAGRLAPEEEDDAGFNNTLGTMLRQLGIDPEIFGWDDEKEAFSD